MHYLNRHLFFCCLALSLALCCCKTRRVKTQADEPQEKSAFYTLRLTKDTVQHTTSAELRSVMLADVKINYLPDEAKTREPNFLSIEITYKNNRVVQAFTEHPLYKRFDLYSESGQIESKLISLQQGEVTFRVPYFEDYKKMRIVETVNYKPAAPLILKNEKQ